MPLESLILSWSSAHRVLRRLCLCHKRSRLGQILRLCSLKLDREPHARPGAYLGADIGTNQTIARIEWGSPAQESGLIAQDQILALDGVPVANRKLDDILKTRQPGETAALLVVHDSMVKELRVRLGQKTERTFKTSPAENPSPLETAILKGWLNN
jgi:predicted metalloprotease with PDZ domain